MDSEPVSTLTNTRILQKLRELPAFRFFEKRDIHNILTFSSVRAFQENEVVIQEGSFDDRVYFLISGRLSVRKSGEVIHELRRTGEIFGEMCIVDGTARSATVTAEEPSLCLVTDMSFIDRMNSEDRSTFGAVFYRIVAEVLASRLREANEELVRLRELCGGADGG